MFDVQSWLSSGGLILLAALVFAESGLLLGFFLPATPCCSSPGSSAPAPVAASCRQCPSPQASTSTQRLPWRHPAWNSEHDGASVTDPSSCSLRGGFP